MQKRDLLILILALLTAVAVTVLVFHNSAVTTGSWGLSFQEEGQPPVGSAGVDQLKEFDAVYRGDSRDPVIYLKGNKAHKSLSMNCKALNLNLVGPFL